MTAARVAVRPLADEPLTARDLAVSAIAQIPLDATTTGQPFLGRSPSTLTTSATRHAAGHLHPSELSSICRSLR